MRMLIIVFACLLSIDLEGKSVTQMVGSEVSVVNSVNLVTNIAAEVDCRELQRIKLDIEDWNRTQIRELYHELEEHFELAERKLDESGKRRFNEWKAIVQNIMEESRAGLDSTLSLFGIIATIIVGLISVFGVIFPFVSELVRKYRWNKMTKSVEAKVAEYDVEMHRMRGLVYFNTAQLTISQGNNKSLNAEERIRYYGAAIKELTKAIRENVDAKDVAAICSDIRSLRIVVMRYVRGIKSPKTQPHIDAFIKGWTWPIDVSEIKQFLKKREKEIPRGHTYNQYKKYIEDSYNEYW